ncbi:uncharacterized protein LOC133795707 [Humulus lupulus]|uniref:uncharacterized protein LOC133795707 n=1 Tax=Humulus lupulus TaxID=3486 RepID=UPI002B416D8D|nr:uncharacterized protein LOC133795707 [Humulus lupulus]
MAEDISHIEFLHNDLLVITVQLANRRVRRIIIESGSSVNVLFRSTLENMRPSVADLKVTSMTLNRFLGEGTVVIGTIRLVVTLGDDMRVVAKILEFVVIDFLATYNAILGQPMLMTFEAITSIQQLAMKFPSTSSICTVRGDQLTARECYSITTKEKLQPGQQAMVIIVGNKEPREIEISHGVEEPREGDNKVTQHDNINPILGKDRSELQALDELKEINMVGINPNVMMHTLNLDRNMPAKVQKRRLLGKERLEALEE